MEPVFQAFKVERDILLILGLNNLQNNSITISITLAG